MPHCGLVERTWTIMRRINLDLNWLNQTLKHALMWITYSPILWIYPTYLPNNTLKAALLLFKELVTVWQWSGSHGARPGCVWALELRKCRASWRGSGQGCQWSPRPRGRTLFCGRGQAPCDLDPGPQLRVENNKQSGNNNATSAAPNDHFFDWSTNQKQ